MSSIFQGLLDASGRIRTGAGPITHAFRSLPMNAAGGVVIGNGPVANFTQGIPRNAAGEVVFLNAAQPTSYGPGATPYGPNGELVGVGATGVIAVYHQGVPYDAAGRYVGSSTPGQTIVAQDFTITPATISVSSAGYRASPLAGALSPASFNGTAVALVQATDFDEFRVQAAGGGEFAGIQGNLTVQIGPYLGGGRLVLAWDALSGWYDTAQPGIYAYMVQQIGQPTAMRFSAAPT